MMQAKVLILLWLHLNSGDSNINASTQQFFGGMLDVSSRDVCLLKRFFQNYIVDFYIFYLWLSSNGCFKELGCGRTVACQEPERAGRQ